MILYIKVIILLVCSFCYSSEVEQKKNIKNSEIGYNLSPLVELDAYVNDSKKLTDYCWEKSNELEGCFRNSSVMILDYNNTNFAYLYRVESQSEDLGVIYKVKILNIDKNTQLLDELIFTDNESYYLDKNKDLNLIYKNNKNKINEKLKKYNMSFSIFKLKYLPYIQDNSDFSVEFSTIWKDVKFGGEYAHTEILKNILVKKNGKLIFKQNYSSGNFCKECIYPFFKMDPLAVIELPNGKKILVLGLLAYDFYSPKTLQYQFIGI